MRRTQLLVPTVKEVPAEAEIPSHQLMIRAGFIRKVASGTYTYLPLGWRSLRKIIDIVREEIDAAGAQEILVPALQPVELWQKTGRDEDYGQTMCRFTDRHGRVNVLAPTAEEVVTTLVAVEINSYKQLPLNLYQISTKFRDEFRPRFGALRSREFIMKDAYSFDVNLDGLEQSYRKMYEAYQRIFDRCGLKYVVVEAESGPVGGSASHEFMVTCDSGEDIIVHTDDYSYSANIEKAEVDPLPQANEAVRKNIPTMDKVHTPNVGTIEAVCEFLDTKPAEMIKTLVYTGPQGATIAIVRGDHEINESKLARAAGASHLELADEQAIKTFTSAEVGFAGPMGLAQKADKFIIDHAVTAMTGAVTGANEKDYHVRNVVPGRDFPLEGDNVIVADIRNAAEGDTYENRPLVFSRGIEVGHVFKLGDKYSKVLGATFLDENGSEQICMMGCYGIGVNRILAGAIELYHDKNGCVLPPSIAPFEVVVLPLNNDDSQVVSTAQKIYDDLLAGGVDVLIDDRDARPGVKFKDADLIGIPIQVVVGQRGLKEDKVEVKRRTAAEPEKINTAEASAAVMQILEAMK